MRNQKLREEPEEAEEPKKEKKNERKQPVGEERKEARRSKQSFESLPGWQKARERVQRAKVEPRDKGEKLNHTKYGLTVGGARKRHVEVPKLTSILHTGGKSRRQYDLGDIKKNG